MDAVTHALTGLVVSHATYKDEFMKDNVSLRIYAAAGMLGAVSPDFDVVTRLFGDKTFYFLTHRTYTHSPFITLALALFCALLAKLLRKKARYSILLRGAFFGMLSHVPFDLMNTYSTLALWPFSNRMYAFGIISIIDLVIFSTYVIGLILYSVRFFRPYRRQLFSTVLAVVLVYIGFRAYMQHSVRDFVLEEYKRGRFKDIGGITEVQRTSVMTDFMGINSWNFIIENEGEYIKGKVNYREGRFSRVTAVAKREPSQAVDSAMNTPIGKFMYNFTHFLDCTVEDHEKGYIVWLTDLRYTFPLNVGDADGYEYTRIVGGYVVLDKQYNPLYWEAKSLYDRGL
jgi:membrane-bound metal-dependent hydrolase YbcI (DUF457 family)